MSVIRSPCERVVIESGAYSITVWLGIPNDDNYWTINKDPGNNIAIVKPGLDDLICVLTELKGVLDGDPQGAGPVRSSE